MKKLVLEYIARNIDLIETDLQQFYHNLYIQLYNNGFVRKITEALEYAKIDTSFVRQACLYSLFEDICSEAVTGGEQNLHRLLDNEPNWFGYTIEEVIDQLKQDSFNLAVDLIPIDDKIFNAPNYIIKEL